MPTVSATSKIRRLRGEIERPSLRPISASATRVDLALEVRGPKGEVLVTAGGAWVDCQKEYVGTFDHPHVVKLVSSQVPAAIQLAEWFKAYERDDPDRQALEIYVDNRRGGKTFFSVLALLLFALRYPDCHLGKTVCWLVVPTFPQQRELHEVIAKVVPPAWFRDGRLVYRKSEKYYTLANGAEIWIKSADRPQSLKAGGVAATAINEAQQVDSKGILNALGANVDGGGICFLAMNPPDSVKALWAENVHDAVNSLDDNGKPVVPWARETSFPAALNEVINQEARTRYGQLAKIIDPKQADRDFGGMWTSIVDRAYPKYKRDQHFRPEPVGWKDITAECNNFTGLGGRMAGNRPLGAGMDFQRRPACAFIEAKAYISPPGLAWIAPGLPVFVIRHEVFNEVANIADWWTEDEFCRVIAEKNSKRGFKPKDYLLVADMTGRSQGSEAASRGPEADPETFSWAIVQSYGWDPHAPREEDRIVGLHGGRMPKGPTELKTFRANPPVPVRLDVVNTLFQQNRIIIASNCKETAESFRQCEVYKDSRKPHGHGSHLTDAVGYLLYAWETALRAAGVVKVAPAEANASLSP